MIDGQPEERDILSDSVSDHVAGLPGRRYKAPQTVEGDALPDKPESTESRGFWANLGQAVHYRILNNYANQELELPSLDIDKLDCEWVDPVEYANEAVELWERAPIEIWESVFVEERVWVPFHGKYMNGRLDFYGIIDGYNSVLDLTISPNIRAWKGAQVSAYVSGLREDDYPVERAYLVSVCPDPLRSGNRPKIRILGEEDIKEYIQEFRFY